MITESITTMVKNILSPYLKEGIIAVDLTAGNGNDTCFLASKVGKEGKVYAFDVQATALEKTRLLLLEKGFLSRASLIHDGHENLAHYIDCKIGVAMANLGYLPGSDKRIVTKPETTIKALSSVLDKLIVGGVMSIVIYYGHEGGELERKNVQAFIDQLDEFYFDVVMISYPNRKNKAPIIYFVHKRKDRNNL